MNKLHDTIKLLKEKRDKLLRLKGKRNSCDTIHFYEDSTKITKFNTGMVIIITKDKVIKRMVPRNKSHGSVAQDIINRTFGANVDFSNINGDFGNIIPKEYGCVFIRIVSVLSGASMVYYPTNCNEFQINELRKFNNEVKTFNTDKKDSLKACFDYNSKGDEIEYNIDNIIDEITKKKHII